MKTLNDLIEHIQDLNEAGYEVHLEGVGDSRIELVYDNIYIV